MNDMAPIQSPTGASTRVAPSTPGFTPLPEPVALSEQSWPEGTVPLLCTTTFAFNHESYVGACLDGILMQKTTFPVRICIHDDASTDSTAEVIRTYQQAHPGKIHAFFQEKNTFTHPNRMALQREYRAWTEEGRYIAMCEGDDYWLDPLKLQKQVEILEKNPDFSLCVHDVEVSHEGIPVAREVFYDVPHPGSFAFTYEDYFRNHFFHTASKVYRVPADVALYHKVIRKVRAGDMASNHLLLSMGNGYYIGEKMAFKRRNEGGYTRSRLYHDERLLDTYNLWKEIHQFAPKRKLKHVCQVLAEIERQLVKRSFRERKVLSLAKYAVLSSVHHPGWYVSAAKRHRSRL